MTLRPAARSSLPDDVAAQLRGQILVGRWTPGETLPSERALAELLGVNRGAVREALQRLASAGLVRSRQGSGNMVLDYRQEAGLDLIPELLVLEGGRMDLIAVRSVAELRQLVGADAARLAAKRADAPHLERLELAMDAFELAGARAERQGAALEVWEAIVEASGNIAYRLAFNSLKRAYAPLQELLRDVLGPELDDVDGHDAIARHIAAGEADEARAAAWTLLGKGSDALSAVAIAIEGQP